MTVIKNDSEQILKSLDANLPFVSELLQADIKLFIKNHNDDIVVHNYFHPNQDSLYLGPQRVSSETGVKIQPHKDVLIAKAFRLGKPILGQFGLVINNRRIQEFAFPVFFDETKKNKVADAVITIERDIYTTRATLGQHWDLMADILIKSVKQKIIDKTTFPNIAFGEGSLILKTTDGAQNIFFANPLSVNLLSEIAEHASQLIGRHIDEIFINFPRKINKKILSQAVVKKEEITLRQRNLVLRYVQISDDFQVLLLKDNSEVKMKETLLKEIHHRVKNNLQTIVSLLRMQKRRNPELESSFNEAINRTNSIALVHEHLARSNDIENVDFGQLAQIILKGLITSFGAEDVQLIFNCPDKIFMLSEDATNLALVFNEILTNTLEHTMGKISKIDISLMAKEKNLHMLFKDDGGGFKEGFDYKKSTGLGWEIIRNISEDSLRGKLSVTNYDHDENTRGIQVDLLIPNILTS
jgi:two-component sensor histidine kinase